MKYFLDCEFYEDGKTIDLLSIGIVAEDGREFYAVNADADWDRLWNPGHWGKAQWVRDNVLPQIGSLTKISAADIRDSITAFCPPLRRAEDGSVVNVQPEFWGYYCASDWVAFYQLWGRLIDLPKHFPRWCHDIKQFQETVGKPRLLFDPKIHHALEDARWQKQAYLALVEHAKQKAAEERVRLPLALLGIQ